ncbi:MAG: hypothetical protein PHR44_01310 [Candidatus Omnitrophica bacterium]|nr:hypothetical protein [Candidatus Omnitrophota bacterium]
MKRDVLIRHLKDDVEFEDHAVGVIADVLKASLAADDLKTEDKRQINLLLDKLSADTKRHSETIKKLLIKIRTEMGDDF